MPKCVLHHLQAGVFLHLFQADKWYLFLFTPKEKFFVWYTEDMKCGWQSWSPTSTNAFILQSTFLPPVSESRGDFRSWIMPEKCSEHITLINTLSWSLQLPDFSYWSHLRATLHERFHKRWVFLLFLNMLLISLMDFGNEQKITTRFCYNLELKVQTSYCCLCRLFLDQWFPWKTSATQEKQYCTGDEIQQQRPCQVKQVGME